ncbi:glycosyltransferase family 2 protein [Lacisediminihabitans sp.]|uniref:glycosyltransferase family 2 protein n=1 Tax=Lacisediminihabitans sp. TaxID=2787631 RepID=UPI00374D99EB
MASSSQPPISPKVAVVTVSYGSGDVLEGFLASVPASSTDELVVVVADNKPEDGDLVASLAGRASARYLPLAENRGYGGGMNAAIRALPAQVEWVLISNPDVELGRGAVDVLVAAGSEDPRIAAVGPAILTDGVVYPSARSVPSLRTGVGHALFANLWLGNPWTKAYRRDSDLAPVRRDAGWLSGACVLVRRSAFDEIGGFDEGFFMYFEDVDLGYRLGKLGYRNVYEPAAVVTHTGAHSTNEDSARMISAHHDSARRFLNKKYSGALLWPVRATLTVGLSARSALLRRRAGHH